MAVKTIVVKGQGIRKEAPAGGAVTPGHLVMRNSSGQFVVHTGEAAFATPLFAVENEVVGQGIDTAYAANDTCHAEALPRGAEVNVIIADGETIAIGDKLVSNGDGTFRELVVTDPTDTFQEIPILEALEAVTTSGSTARCIAEVI